MLAFVTEVKKKAAKKGKKCVIGCACLFMFGVRDDKETKKE